MSTLGEVRQRNYFILKRLWFLFRPNDSIEDFYEIVGMHRNRYGALVNIKDRNVKMGETSTALAEKSGAEEDVFFGKKYISVSGISDDEWQSYFILAKECLEEKYGITSDTVEKKQTENKRKMKEFDLRLNSKLKDSFVMPDVDMNLYRLCYWIKNGERYSGRHVFILMQQIITAIERISFEELEGSYGTPEFEKYYKNLNSHIQKVTAIKNYNSAKSS